MADRNTTHTLYVGLWPRCMAFAMDYLPIAVYLLIILGVGMVVNQRMPSVSQNLFGNPISAQVSGFLFVTLPVILYFSLSEASGWQASWGKWRMHLKVTTQDGAPLGRGRSLGRTILKLVPWELSHTLIWQISFAKDQWSTVLSLGLALVWLLVGANMASLLISPKRQALYDRIAKTVVVRNTIK